MANRKRGIRFLLTFLLSCSAVPSAAQPAGTLQLTIRDQATRTLVSARVEILGSDGSYYVAEDALPVGGDCDMSDEGAGYVDLASTLAGFSDRVSNPYSNSTQFYSTGTSLVRLPVGLATIRVFKGPEYRVAAETIEVEPSTPTRQDIRLRRWVNMPESGWYSADDHLHIPRPVIELNPTISKMMQAEDRGGP